MSKLLKPDTETSRDEIIRQGRRIYDEKLKNHLEPLHLDRFVAIEPATGRYFLGDTGADALSSARSAMPDRLFYLMRIGHRAAHKITGHASKIR